MQLLTARTNRADSLVQCMQGVRISLLRSYEKGKITARLQDGALTVASRLASVHTYTAEALPFGRELIAAEEAAKQDKKNVCRIYPMCLNNAYVWQIWSDYTGEDAQPAAADEAGGALAAEYLDVYVSAVRDSDPFGFSVQILDDSSKPVNVACNQCLSTCLGVASLEKLMSDFSLHHRQSTSSSPSGFSPKTGDLVSAKFSEDDQW
jgi:staphylococcal nuclease domain-containing protein 1